MSFDMWFSVYRRAAAGDKGGFYNDVLEEAALTMEWVGPSVASTTKQSLRAPGLRVRYRRERVIKPFGRTPSDSGSEGVLFYPRSR